MIKQSGTLQPSATVNYIIPVGQYRSYLITGTSLVNIVLTVNRYYNNGVLESTFTQPVGTTPVLIDHVDANNNIAYIELLNAPASIPGLTIYLEGSLQ